MSVDLSCPDRVKGVLNVLGEGEGVKQLLVVCLFILLPVLCSANEWSPWALLNDGILNGVEFSHRSDCPTSTENSGCALLWRFLNNYEDPAEVEFTITWDTGKELKSETRRTTLQPGENSSSAFSVSGTALEEVSVRAITATRTSNTVRKTRVDAQPLQEQSLQAETRQKQENAARPDLQSRTQTARSPLQGYPGEQREKDERSKYSFVKPATDCITTFINTSLNNWLAYRNNCSAAVHVFYSNPGFGALDIGPGQVQNSGWECGDGCTPSYGACPEGYTVLNTVMEIYTPRMQREQQPFMCGKLR